MGIRITTSNPFIREVSPLLTHLWAWTAEMYNRVLGLIAEAEAALETAYGLVDRLQGKGFDQE